MDGPHGGPECGGGGWAEVGLAPPEEAGWGAGCWLQETRTWGGGLQFPVRIPVRLGHRDLNALRPEGGQLGTGPRGFRDDTRF